MLTPASSNQAWLALQKPKLVRETVNGWIEENFSILFLRINIILKNININIFKNYSNNF